MKKIILLIMFSFIVSITLNAQTYVNGYTKKDGTVVQGHYRSDKDKTNTNNYSTSGNSNPYTNTSGTKAKDYSTEANNYGKGKTINTGPQGGQYYKNDNGNKTYVPKQSSSSSSTTKKKTNTYSGF